MSERFKYVLAIPSPPLHSSCLLSTILPLDSQFWLNFYVFILYTNLEDKDTIWTACSTLIIWPAYSTLIYRFVGKFKNIYTFSMIYCQRLAPKSAEVDVQEKEKGLYNRTKSNKVNDLANHGTLTSAETN